MTSGSSRTLHRSHNRSQEFLSAATRKRERAPNGISRIWTIGSRRKSQLSIPLKTGLRELLMPVPMQAPPIAKPFKLRTQPLLMQVAGSALALVFSAMCF